MRSNGLLEHGAILGVSRGDGEGRNQTHPGTEFMKIFAALLTMARILAAVGRAGRGFGRIAGKVRGAILDLVSASIAGAIERAKVIVASTGRACIRGTAMTDKALGITGVDLALAGAGVLRSALATGRAVEQRQPLAHLFQRKLFLMRQALPNRRSSETFGFEHDNMTYTATVSRFPDGGPAEIFLSCGKPGTAVETMSRDAAVAVSLALQAGVSLAVLRHAMTRLDNGRAAGPLGAALDALGHDTP